MKPLNCLLPLQRSVWGGKAVALARMSQARLPIPDGWVINSIELQRFLELNGYKDVVELELRKVLIEGASPISAASALVNLFRNGRLQASLSRDLRSLEQRMDSAHFAVRSSAVGEDGAALSWAGCFDSYLNTSGDLLEARVRDCWASLYGPRSLAYGRLFGASPSDFGMAVIVQQMIAAEFAGFLFTANPVTGGSAEVIIEAIPGPALELADGSTSPLRITCNKVQPDSNNAALKSPCATTHSSISDERSRSMFLALSPAIPTLMRLASEIESLFGAPQEIEWTLCRGKVQVVQSRFITSKP